MSKTNKFPLLFKRLMKIEGGYVNHPRDPGGETMFGVTKRVARAFGYKGSMRLLPRPLAAKIAKQNYWRRIKGDKLPKAVAWQVMDASYNHGCGNAVRFLQRAVGVVDDGRIGNITLTAVNNSDVNDIVLLFNAERLMFFTKLSRWTSFGKGWSRRIVHNLRYAAEDN